MDDLAKALLKIDSIDFTVDYGVISGLSLLQRSLAADKHVQDAQLWCNASIGGDHTTAVFARAFTLTWALHLVGRPVDPHYAHPDDMALAAYLIVLRGCPEAKLLAAGILNLESAGHWSRSLAVKVFSVKGS